MVDEIRVLLQQYNQEHLLKYIDELSKRKRE